MASSSSSSHSAPAAASSRSCKYDVFLSFRGEDTRKTFVDHLYSSLEQHLLCVYKDDKALPRGDSIDQSLFEAIEESQIAVIIFSKNYVDSSWCLEELAHIMKCRNERELIVIPVFYDVEPTQVRNQKGKFGEAEAKNVTKAEKWRKALVDVSNIAGWEPKNIADGHESQFIKIIVDTILDKLFTFNSYVDEDLVGMRARFQELESLLDIGSDGVRMVGIWGVGGGGKTTLAYSLYKKISKQFHGHCMIENVRETTNQYGLVKLQMNMISALFKNQKHIHGVREGKDIIKKMVQRRKVLVLLDDVDTVGQLEALAGNHNWFGNGSRIIVTTRDEHLLKTHKVDHIYPVTLLSVDEAIRLFKIHAYNEKDPVEDYKTLSLRVVSYASGLPLVLKVLGSFLYDKKKSEWISALKKLKEIPDIEVMDVLKISYDGLETYQKQLFLDIACFWRFTCLSDVMKILDACGYHPEIGIKVLRQKALLYVVVNSNYGDRFDMHDMVQEMAHYIVRGEHPNDPEKHSRVWKLEEIKQLCFRGGAIMDNNTTEAIFYNFNYSLPTCKLVSNMKKLRWLIMSTKDEDEGPSFLSNELRYIRWDNCSARSPFPYGFLPVKLVVLKLSNSMLNELWRGDQYLPHLKVLELVCWEKLLNIPDFNGLPRLQRLKLVRCKELEEIHESLGNLTSLESLKVTHCWKLKRLPTISRMKNMKALIIEECYLKDGEIPCGIDELSNLQELNLSGNSFSLLDFTISQLTQLKRLNLSFCDKLLELPELPSSLVNLQAHGCKSLTIVEDFYKHCKELCQVSLEDYWWREGLLESMLKGKADDNGCMYLSLEGLGIPKRFRPPPLRGKKCSRLELQENWCNDFSGFLLCFVFSDGVYPNRDDTRISIKQVRGIDSEDDLVWEWDRYHGMDFKDGVVWEESDSSDHGGMTWVWYVSFGSLRHTAWWDPTYKALAFKINDFMQFSGFGVRLVEKKSTSGLTETSTDSSSYKHTPRIEIQEDSASQLGVSLLPSGVRYRYGITKQPEID